MKKHVLIALIISALLVCNAIAKPGNVENGTKVYNKRCVWCHGEEGEGDGPAAERLNPPPRDFSSGMYKIKTTGFDDPVPNDEDIYRMIAEGMPGTAMPGWDDIISEQDMWDLVAYIKTFAGYEEEKPTDQVDYGKQIQSSEDSIKKGKELFIDRCSECHGEEGKGNAIKKLKDDLGFRTWPRNLTKPWTFRGSNDPRDIYSRISVGIHGTQMPSFADPASKKKLSIEERWHVANYAASLAKTEKVVKGENTVVKAEKLEGDLPHSPTDEKWASSEPTTFYLLPQIIAKDRFFTPSNDTITLRAFYNDKEISMLLEWDDRTKSIPGDSVAANIADENLFEDGVAVQLPLAISDDPSDMEKPYFGMGDASNPVNVWHWKSGTTEKPEMIQLLNSKGFGAIEKRDAATVGLEAKSHYEKGAWRVVMKRPLTTADGSTDLQIPTGRFVPIAFAAWDGSNSEKGSKHTMSTWYWLFLKPAAGADVYYIPLLVIAVIIGGEFWWFTTARRKNGKSA
ncbi:MAG: ethylbenzene dehydrogenase-related protein [Deltaproteobacteria bacterium]|nr:ethylbenzene dehydrogenase-related protein [Deltaproteobacteria bacterium]